MDLMVVIDGTITFGYDNFDNMKSFVSAVLSKLPIGRSGVRVGIIQFSDQWSTAVEMNLGEHGGVDSVLSFLKRMDYMQGYFTLTGMALEMANDQVTEFNYKLFR